MPDQPWLERFAAELTRRRVPPTEQARLVRELRDHLTDLANEGERMEALETRIGPPDELAEAAAAESLRRTRRRRRWSAALLIAGPLPAAFLLMYLYLLLLVGIGMACGLDRAENGLSACATLSPTQRWSVRAAHQSLKFVPFAVAAVAFAWVVRRSGRDWRWAASAVGVVALMAASFDTSLRLPVEAGTGYLVADFFIGAQLKWVQAAVPLAVGAMAFALWRPRHSTFA